MVFFFAAPPDAFIDLRHKSLPSGLGMDPPSPMDSVEMEDT